MSLKRKVLYSLFALASLGLLAAGDCDVRFGGVRGWPVFYDPYPVVIYDPVIYDPFFPCCFW